jgi:arylsulfatase A
MKLCIRIIVASVCIAVSAQIGLAQNLSSKQKPNVILILADDMGVGDMSYANGGISRTPNLDKLKGESVWFNSGYSASAVCAPARAALLTGKYPHRTGVVSLSMSKNPELTSLKRSETTIADMFKQNGYKTGLIGKWHLGTGEYYRPMKRGFQETAYFTGVKTYYDYKLDINGTSKDYQGDYLTDVLTQHTLDYLDRNKNSPFFLHLAYYSPHRPLGAPEDIINYYRSKGLDENTSKVYAMIEVMDKGIGQILRKLDDLNIRENTIVIFTSDNGPDPLTGNRFNAGLTGRKYSVHEGGIRVPFLFNWKNKLAARSTDELAHFCDVVPTLIDICNLKVSKNVSNELDGGSLYPTLRGKSSDNLPSLRYWQWNRGIPHYTHNAALRDAEWKLMFPTVTRNEVTAESTRKPVLYNLKNDPTESKDVSEANKIRYDAMKIKLEAWTKKMELERLKNADDHKL